MENPEMMMVLLQKITELGPGLAIDDFGVGYCGLSYLRHFQFSRLKIDQSFVRSVLTDPRDSALTAAIVNIARVLKMKVIAECVETAGRRGGRRGGGGGRGRGGRARAGRGGGPGAGAGAG